MAKCGREGRRDAVVCAGFGEGAAGRAEGSSWTPEVLRALALLGSVATGNVPRTKDFTHSRFLCEFIKNIWEGEGKHKPFYAVSQGTCVKNP